MYFANRDENTRNYLALNEKLDAYIETVASTIKQVKAKKRSKKDVYISLRRVERLVPFQQEGPRDPRRQERLAACAGPARRHLQFRRRADGRLILNTFIRRSDVVKIACIAQLVNVIAPIMTEPRAPAWGQTIYYPYYFASVFGRGTALQLDVNSPGLRRRRCRQRALSSTSPACTMRKTAR